MFKKTKLTLSMMIIFFIIVGMFSAVQAQEIIMKLAMGDSSHINVGDERLPFITYAQLTAFGNAVNELSNGEIAVDIYTNGALGSDREALEQLNQQIIHGVATNEGVLPNWYNPIQVLALPYIFEDETIAWDVLDGPFGQKMFDDMAEKSNYRVISVGSNGGYRMFANNERPLEEPADFEGLKIRTQEIPAQMELVEGQGALATSVSWPEVYNALQTGVVDGAELPLVGAVAQSHQEVIDYVTIDKHLYSPMFIVINEEWYRSLSEENQEAIRKAGRIAGTTSRGFSLYSASKVVEFFKDEGIEVSVLSTEQREALKDNSYSKVREWLVDEVGETWVTDFEEAVEEATN